MFDTVITILTLGGALGLFLYGMKIMSEGLQKLASERMRKVLAVMTSTPFARILTGVLITVAIQSSSATTVMVVSFVNAGLLSLTQSIGIIMGANIGTTFTAWLIALLGFKADIGVLSLPLIGVGFLLLTLKNSKRKTLGEIIIGFSLIFLGLSFLKNYAPSLYTNPNASVILQSLTDKGYLSVLIFVAIGTVLTMLIQSSTATVAITIVICSFGWIPFELGAAMILGENIGTTITANLAAIVGNISAKRAARAHLVFNLFGVAWMLVFFYPFLHMLDYLLVQLGSTSPFTSTASQPIALALFHTLFNVINTAILVWFTPAIVKVVTKMVKQKEVEEVFRLTHVSSKLLSTAELSLHESKQEIALYGKRCIDFFLMVRKLLMETNDKEFYNLLERIQLSEEICDKIEVEIASYLNKIAEGDLSGEGRLRLHAMYRIISEIESVADSCYRLATTLKRKKMNNIWFDEDMRSSINQHFNLIEQALDVMVQNIKVGYHKLVNIDNAVSVEQVIDEKTAELFENHLINLEEKKYSYNAGILYADIISETERLGNHIINVSEAIAEVKNSLAYKDYKLSKKPV